MTCLDNVISVKGNCTDITPSSGIYINTFLAGMSIQEVDASLNKEYESAYDFIQQQIENAGTLISSHIRAHFAPRFKGASVIENAVSGFFVDDQKVVSSQAAYLVGKQIEVEEYPYLEFFLSRIALQAATTGDKSVYVYDLISNKLLDTLTVSCVSGQVSYKDVYKSYPTNGQKLNLFICWLADVDYYRTDLTKGGGCHSCQNYSYSNKYVTISVRKILNASGKLDQNTESLDYDGLSITYSLNCTFDPFLCSIKNLLAVPLAYKTGELILQNMVHSKRTNSLINVYHSDNKELMAFYGDKYEFEMEQILKNLKLPDDICFECNKRGFFRTNLP